MCICTDEERVGGLITRQRAEQIGRNIGQYGCVIPEQQHLPECPCEPCICSYLRACEERGYADAIAECILLGYRHIDRVNEEAEAAISEQVANQLFMNADGIEFFVSKLRALQTLRKEKK